MMYSELFNIQLVHGNIKQHEHFTCRVFGQNTSSCEFFARLVRLYLFCTH